MELPDPPNVTVHYVETNYVSGNVSEVKDALAYFIKSKCHYRKLYVIIIFNQLVLFFNDF